MAPNCPTCGALYDPAARFCRRCGAQVGPGAPSSSPSEATTWTLEQTPQPNIGTQAILQPSTGPAYLEPQTFPPGPLATNGLAPKRNTAAIVLFAVLLVALLAVGAGFLTYFLAQKSSPPSVSPPPPSVPSGQASNGTVIPPPPPVPQVPAIQPAPPAPPSNPSGTKPTGSSTGELTLESLRYPGSQSTLNISGGGHGIMMLSSEDPVDKIVQWYSERIHVDQKVFETAGKTVLRGSGFSVMITSSGSETSIMVMHSSKD